MVTFWQATCMIRLFLALVAAAATFATPMSGPQLQKLTDAAATEAVKAYRLTGTTGLEILVEDCYTKLGRQAEHYATAPASRCIALDSAGKTIDAGMGPQFTRPYFASDVQNERVRLTQLRMDFASDADGELFMQRLATSIQESVRHLAASLD